MPGMVGVADAPHLLLNKPDLNRVNPDEGQGPAGGYGREARPPS